MNQNERDFVRSFAWAFAGTILGSMLDNTRFGRWFNTSKFIGFVFDLIKVVILALVGLYVYFVIKAW